MPPPRRGLPSRLRVALPDLGVGCHTPYRAVAADNMCLSRTIAFARFHTRMCLPLYGLPHAPTFAPYHTPTYPATTLPLLPATRDACPCRTWLHACAYAALPRGVDCQFFCLYSCRVPAAITRGAAHAHLLTRRLPRYLRAAQRLCLTTTFIPCLARAYHLPVDLATARTRTAHCILALRTRCLRAH